MLRRFCICEFFAFVERSQTGSAQSWTLNLKYNVHHRVELIIRVFRSYPGRAFIIMCNSSRTDVFVSFEERAAERFAAIAFEQPPLLMDHERRPARAFDCRVKIV